MGERRFEAPHELEAVLAGTLGDSFSFFGEYTLFEAGDVVGNLFLTVDEPLSAVLAPVGSRCASGASFPRSNRFEKTVDGRSATTRSAPCELESQRFVFCTGGAFTSRAREFLDEVAAPCERKPLSLVEDGRQASGS